MLDRVSWFHFQNLQDDFIKYYRATEKHRIDEIKLSRLSILYGAATLNRRIEYIFQNEETKGMVICAHLKHSKIHDFYIIVACLIYGYTLMHTNWHGESEETLRYKLRTSNCRLVIVDDDMDTESMVSDVKYLRLSDIYAESIYRKGLSLNSYLSLVDSLGKESSDYRIQEMLSDQSKHVGSLSPDAVMMITFTNGGIASRPRARKVTYREMAGHFKSLEAMNAWTYDDTLVVFMTNPTYDFFTSIVLYYCLSRGNVRMHFLQRYMSTYWKILWESNEHAKNVFTQLGKSYKILSFLFPRQLEALLTLDEVAQECKLLNTASSLLMTPRLSKSYNHVVTDSPESQHHPPEPTLRSEHKDAAGYATPRSGSPVEGHEDSVPFQGESGTQLASTPSRLASLGAAKAGIGRVAKYIWGKSSTKPLDDFMDSQDGPSDDALGSVEDPLPEKVTAEPAVKRSSSVPRTGSSPRSDCARMGSLYIPKLHLKFTELRNVLCDKSVYFLLSGTHANLSLCRLFARLTGGKTPSVRYGCTEISPTITLVPPCMDQHQLLELYELGVSNMHNGARTPGLYIGNTVSDDVGLRVVKSVDKMDPNFLVPCAPSEPGYFVCNAGDRSDLILPREFGDSLMEDGTYLAMDDVGFFLEHEDAIHYYWSYKIDHSAPRGAPYPYFGLLCTSQLIQRSICTRYDLTEPVVRVETLQISNADGSTRIITAVELITNHRSEIAADLRSTFLELCKSVGMFTDCPAPDELRVVSIPWAYKGSVSFPVLRVRSSTPRSTIMSQRLIYNKCKRILIGSSVAAVATATVSDHLVTLRWVNNDAMSPVLFSLDGSRDLAVVIRASRYYRNDVVLYKHPVTGKESFGRLLMLNASEDLDQLRKRVPCGHCWVENDNPRSDEPDSREFGAIPLGLLRGCVLATIYPFSRAKVIVN
ncbi:mitochondrial inner membrane protease subunit 2-like [Babesia ovis]|uniref:Mitochondrial inner membrane protease subunit 2-like n=1 Tax=Babesia ovis TaxID=5869 RepID=A0A9W5TEA6_BABOV|nr:mitochondrial inner membrane protease subunit 2-like [Babesia ovis]